MTRPFESVMVRTLMRPLIAALQLFALYVVIHGHYSPGGGFQGGVLLAASMILPLLFFGREHGGPAGVLTVGVRGATIMAAVGVAIFAGVGIVPLLFGRPMLDYAALPLPLDEAWRRSMGILVIEIGVTLGVAGSVLAIYHALYAVPLREVGE